MVKLGVPYAVDKNKANFQLRAATAFILQEMPHPGREEETPSTMTEETTVPPVVTLHSHTESGNRALSTETM